MTWAGCQIATNRRQFVKSAPTNCRKVIRQNRHLQSMEAMVANCANTFSPHCNSMRQLSDCCAVLIFTFVILLTIIVPLTQASENLNLTDTQQMNVFANQLPLADSSMSPTTATVDAETTTTSLSNNMTTMMTTTSMSTTSMSTTSMSTTSMSTTSMSTTPMSTTSMSTTTMAAAAAATTTTTTTASTPTKGNYLMLLTDNSGDDAEDENSGDGGGGGHQNDNHNLENNTFLFDESNDDGITLPSIAAATTHNTVEKVAKHEEIAPMDYDGDITVTDDNDDYNDYTDIINSPVLQQNANNQPITTHYKAMQHMYKGNGKRKYKQTTTISSSSSASSASLANTIRFSQCPICRLREEVKLASLESIKAHVLQKLGFDHPPNITEKPFVPEIILQSFFNRTESFANIQHHMMMMIAAGGGGGIGGVNERNNPSSYENYQNNRMMTAMHYHSRQPLSAGDAKIVGKKFAMGSGRDGHNGEEMDDDEDDDDGGDDERNEDENYNENEEDNIDNKNTGTNNEANSQRTSDFKGGKQSQFRNGGAASTSRHHSAGGPLPPSSSSLLGDYNFMVGDQASANHFRSSAADMASMLHRMQADRPMASKKSNAGASAQSFSAITSYGPDVIDDSDEFYSSTKRIYAFAKFIKMRHRKTFDILTFRFNNVQNIMVTGALLHLYVHGTDWLKVNAPLLADYRNFSISIARVVRNNQAVINVDNQQQQQQQTNILTRPEKDYHGQIGDGQGRTIKIDITEMVAEWFNHPFNNHGTIIKTAESWMRQVIVVDETDNQKHIPYIEIISKDIRKRRTKRNIALTCRENDNEKRCCRYPLTVDFKTFGWDWVIAPHRYVANYCAGECAIAFLPRYAHTHVMQLSTSVQPCCSPRKMSPLQLLYYDLNFNIVFDQIPNMVVEKCGCS